MQNKIQLYAFTGLVIGAASAYVSASLVMGAAALLATKDYGFIPMTFSTVASMLGTAFYLANEPPFEFAIAAAACAATGCTIGAFLGKYSMFKSNREVREIREVNDVGRLAAIRQLC